MGLVSVLCVLPSLVSTLCLCAALLAECTSLMQSVRYDAFIGEGGLRGARSRKVLKEQPQSSTRFHLQVHPQADLCWR